MVMEKNSKNKLLNIKIKVNKSKYKNKDLFSLKKGTSHLYYHQVQNKRKNIKANIWSNKSGLLIIKCSILKRTTYICGSCIYVYI